METLCNSFCLRSLVLVMCLCINVYTGDIINEIHGELQTLSDLKLKLFNKRTEVEELVKRDEILSAASAANDSIVSDAADEAVGNKRSRIPISAVHDDIENATRKRSEGIVVEPALHLASSNLRSGAADEGQTGGGYATGRRRGGAHKRHHVRRHHRHRYALRGRLYSPDWIASHFRRDGPANYEEADIKRLQRNKILTPGGFELYPKWYSNRIPGLFGRGFAERYFHPFGQRHSVRATIPRNDSVSRPTAEAKREFGLSPPGQSDFGAELPDWFLNEPQHQIPQGDMQIAHSGINPLQMVGGPNPFSPGTPPVSFGAEPEIGLGSPLPLHPLYHQNIDARHHHFYHEQGPSHQRLPLINHFDPSIDAAAAEHFAGFGPNGEIRLDPTTGIDLDPHRLNVDPHTGLVSGPVQSRLMPDHARFMLGLGGPEYGRHVPIEMMEQLNSNMYQPEPVHVAGKLNHEWIDYSSIPLHHHHHHHHVHIHALNPCVHNPCHHGGRCLFTQDHRKKYHFRCLCKPNHGGHYCEDEPLSCHPNPCLNGGTCTKTESGYFCTCAQEFKGTNCGEERGCLRNPCENSGACIETAEGFYCQCVNSFEGKTCEKKITACLANPCKNGGTCTDVEVGGFQCACVTGYGCVDCSCPQRHDMESSLIASGCPLNACKNGGTCISSAAGFSCNCPPGFHASDCGVADLCVPNPCDNNGLCVQDGSENYKCICPYGYKGPSCRETLSCTSHPCSSHSTCVETPSSFHCQCHVGYKGETCRELSPCSRNPCSHDGECVEKGSMYTCYCSKGYRGSTCQERNPCHPSPCLNGDCTEVAGVATCNCSEGWMGDLCEIANECTPNRCLNGGTCVHTLASFKCLCRDEFFGDHCEHLSPCHGENPCLYGGVCEPVGATYVCRCGEGHHGGNCQLISRCNPNPCLHNSRCFEGDDSFICECSHGYTGHFCETQNFCATSPCQNDGTCLEGEGSFSCGCRTGYQGRYCELDLCEGNPCKNGGSCLPASTVYGFICECVFPYHGHTCQELDPCVPNPCKNGGTCRSHLQAIHNIHIHHGPLFHNEDESVVSVVGPVENTTVTHYPYYDQSFHEVVATPDEHEQVYQEEHYHMTPKEGDQVYEDELLHPELQDSNPLHDDQSYDLQSIHNHDERLDDGKVSIHHDGGEDSSPPHIVPDIDDQDDEQVVEAVTEELPKSSSEESSDTAIGSMQSSSLERGKNRKYLDSAAPPVQEQRKRTVINGEDKDLAKWKDEVVREAIMLARKSSKQRRSLRLKPKTSASTSSKERADGKTMFALNFGNKEKRNGEEEESKGEVLVQVRERNSGRLIKRSMQTLFVCECPPGFLGAHCQHKNPCGTRPCLNGGTCIPRGSRYQCRCMPGYGGLNCDDLHPCNPNPCLHGGVCSQSHSIRGYHCECEKGYNGYQCELTDHCAVGNPCQHGGKCISAEKGPECRCRARFEGAVCEVDKCADCNTNAFCRHGHCVCKPGFVGNGFKCKAIGDVCSPNPCDNSGRCVQGQDGKIFSCLCPVGYTGNRCEYPNPCRLMPCQHNGVCVDESNSKSKGILMVDRNDYRCFCAQGYRGKNCEETNLAACSSGPCMNNGTCYDWSSENHRRHLKNPDDFECYCPNGYSGPTCETPRFACFSSPCINGGTCLDASFLPGISFDAHGYKCNCLPGFTGRNCEVTLHGPGPCHLVPCMHDGRCLDMTNNNDPDVHFDYPHEYKCFCDPHYSGRNCEVPYPPCTSGPCFHNGTCLDGTSGEGMSFDETGYHCLCTNGYEGKNCERQYAFATREEEENLLHPTELPDDENFGPTPLVVYVRPSKTPAPLGTPPTPRPGVVIVEGSKNMSPLTAYIRPPIIKVSGSQAQVTEVSAVPDTHPDLQHDAEDSPRPPLNIQSVNKVFDVVSSVLHSLPYVRPGQRQRGRAEGGENVNALSPSERYKSKQKNARSTPKPTKGPVLTNPAPKHTKQRDLFLPTTPATPEVRSYAVEAQRNPYAHLTAPQQVAPQQSRLSYYPASTSQGYYPYAQSNQYSYDQARSFPGYTRTLLSYPVFGGNSAQTSDAWRIYYEKLSQRRQ